MTRNIQKFCFAIFSLMLAFIISSCGKENVTPGSGSGTTGGNVDDPVGTIKLSMRNAANGDTELDYIHIDKDDNFEGYRSWFASVGKVNGLGNVTGIPANGWAEKIAVVPGEGVVAYSDGKFYRIYVQDYVYSAGTNGVIGAEIKYQKPFGGADEAVKFDRKNITIDSKGGTEEVLCANASIIPFTVICSEDWCKVSTISTHEHSWLADCVRLECAENFSESSRTATITVTTQTKKQTTFTVTQAGAEPYVTISPNTTTISAGEGDSYVVISTNQSKEDLSVNVSDSWLKANIVENSDEDNESSVNSYKLSFTAQDNPNTTERRGTITISTKDSKTSAELAVTQEALRFDVMEHVYLDRTGSAQTVTIETSLTSWEADASVSWLHFNKNGNLITIRADEYTGKDLDRTATISFKGISPKITVTQSKYAVGDTFKEGKITGKVVTMKDSIRLICSDNLGEAAWSIENVLTGANSRDDGVYNTNIIKSISSFKTLYPAFALVEALNVDGATGWYLPAYLELWNITEFRRISVWSSCEVDRTTSLTSYWDGNADFKSGIYPVYAFHRF